MRNYNPSVTCADSSLYTGEPRLPRSISVGAALRHGARSHRGARFHRPPRPNMDG